MAAPVDFLLVGTSRSGTTLLQRLLLEIDGVRIPHETHFFSGFMPEVERRGWHFPLTETQVAEVLGSVDNCPDVDVDGLDTTSPGGLFAGITRRMAGDAALVGEKTPAHVNWWRPVLSSWPEAKLIGVVRHPCAVASSHRGVPWGQVTVAGMATRWRWDQMQLAAASSTFPDRVRVVRYEDVVTDPDGSRAQLGAFLSCEVGEVGETYASPSLLHGPGEWWKAGAADVVDQGRVDRWRQTLPVRDQRALMTLCRREMRRFGYQSGMPSPVGRRTVRRVRGDLASRRQAQRRIENLVW